MSADHRAGLDPDPFWYKTGVIYELHVRAFCDSDGNGVGDFRGLTGKLDYLNDLGVTALWLLPFYPSPLRDDGYDIADYCAVHPDYGTLEDFQIFLAEAHSRSLRVITELVLNHTSDQHPWFQRARHAPPGSRWRDFYVWSPGPDRYPDARIIFRDVEASNWAWDPTAQAYYWHRFFAHQPDLNYDNPEVFDEMIKVVEFWLDLGVDGLRLDAVPYLYEREGTSCENLPETHAALRRLRAHVDAKYGDRVLLAEANQWPEDAVTYFGQGQGDECHLAYHFPLMPRLFLALRMEDRTPIVDTLEQTPPIPATAQWALFLRNHDELTLEMVTDEERDYMYRMYAYVRQARLNLGIRRRLAPLLGNDRKRLELLNALLFSLPGTPVLYYGDEIGMGDNIFLGDRNGVRTPMQWSSDKNAGFSRANPQALYLPIIYDPEYHYEAVNVEGQLANPHSLLWWMRRLLALRKKWRALGEGRCQFLHPENRRILSYVLRDESETLLVVANLSRFVQPVELDLSAFRSCVPVELFGRAEFPVITEKLYPLTLGPHSFYWFSLESRPTAAESPAAARAAPQVTAEWPALLRGNARSKLEAVLPDYLATREWFGGRGRTIRNITLTEAVPLPAEGSGAGFLALAQVDYVQKDAEVYALPLAFVAGTEAQQLRQTTPQYAIAELHQGRSPSGLLCDGLGRPRFCEALLDLIRQTGRSQGGHGEVTGTRSAVFSSLHGDTPGVPPVPSHLERSHSLVFFGDKLVLKFFRRLETGVNPDLEIERFLTARQFPHAPALAGALEYLGPRNEGYSLATLCGYVPNAKEAWVLALDSLGRYYDRAGALSAQGEAPPPGTDDARPGFEHASPALQELIGTYLESARLLGERTAALHQTLAAEVEDPAFAPETVTPHHLRALFQSLRNLATQHLRRLRHQLATLPAEVASLAERVLGLEAEIIRRYRPLVGLRPAAKRIRIHGDYHLGQVLWTGRDFVVLDFEGDPAGALSERRLKRSPLRDVAGLIWSLHRAAYVGLARHIERGSLSPENLAGFEPWARFWHGAISTAFLRAYLETMGPSGIVPRAPGDLHVMLQAYLLNRALSELSVELDRRPARPGILLRGICQLLAAGPGEAEA